MFTFPGLPSLEQRVWVSATVIRRGDGIAVQSVATNRGDDPIEVKISCTGVPGISGVDFDWPEDVQVCQGSARVALAPQDSIVRGITTPRVISRPGTYTLQVRHFIDPAFAAPIEVTVIR
ncbi:MAG: hypothetical protein O7D29_04020 [Gemmatimonadetes bacterium]|nr:hypothetical protein [Gemmatimonadota bacterium]